MISKRLPAKKLTILIALLHWIFPCKGFADLDAQITLEIQHRISALKSAKQYHIKGNLIAARNTIIKLYERRKYERLWQKQASVAQLIASIQDIYGDGLSPEEYHLQTITDYTKEVKNEKRAKPEILADMDILMTDSLIRLAYHLYFGKVDPRKLQDGWNLSPEKVRPGYIERIEKAASQSAVAKYLDSLKPQNIYYHRLKAALKQYRRFQAQGGWQQIAQGPVVSVGDRDQRVPAIRQHLARTDQIQAESKAPYVFDAEVSEGLKRFQKRHYLGGNGNLTRATIHELNLPPAYHIEQIRANMERVRWVMHDIPDFFVFVDIASYHVHLVENEKRIKTYKAQVGEPFRQTPAFRALIKTVVVNPTWTVPPVILEKDILPKIRRDIGYIEKTGLVLMDLDGRKIDPASIDWSKVRARSFPHRFRKPPGPDNPMGQVKIMFPNEHYVFIHDTFEKELFEDDWRAQSSGCIRVQRPLELTADLFANDPDWNLDRLHDVVNTGKTKTIIVKPPIPIILYYRTVYINDQGEVYFREDVYERDKAIVRGLSMPFAFNHQG